MAARTTGGCPKNWGPPEKLGHQASLCNSSVSAVEIPGDFTRCRMDDFGRPARSSKGPGSP
eukprot:11852450-Alexandrium_andersonii.AAC.1